MTKQSISMQALMATSGVQFGTSGARGLVASMSDELCFAYTLAFLQLLPFKSGGRVAMAMDLRPSSITIASACAAAIRYVGLQVEWCGAIPTPALALYAQQHNIPALMITGSHIPFDRNGIKFYGLQGEITKDDEMAISAANVALPHGPYTEDLPEVNHSARQTYIARYLNFFEPNFLAGKRIGFFEHASVARDLFTSILKALGAEVIALGRSDTFVSIDTEAVSEVDIKRAQAWAAEYAFDAIISTDGDGDRPLIGDENGQWLRGDIVGLLCARYLGAQSVATPVSCNTAVELCKSFSKVVRTRIGSPYVISAMSQMQASGQQKIIGFEANGGFLVGSNFEINGRILAPLPTRDALLPILSLLAMSKSCKLSQLTQNLPQRFTASDRLQSFSNETSLQILRELAASASAMNALVGKLGGKFKAVDQTDGLRITLGNGDIVHLRQSGNAPELRCYAEANTQVGALMLARDALSLVVTN